MKLSLKRHHQTLHHPVQEDSVTSTKFDEVSSSYPLTNKRIDVTMKSEKKIFEIDLTGSLKPVERISKKPKIKESKSVVMEVGFYLITPLLAGVFLGILVDRVFSTKPLLTIFGLLLGVIATFYNLFKFLRNGE